MRHSKRHAESDWCGRSACASVTGRLTVTPLSRGPTSTASASAAVFTHSSGVPKGAGLRSVHDAVTSTSAVPCGTTTPSPGTNHSDHPSETHGPHASRASSRMRSRSLPSQ